MIQYFSPWFCSFGCLMFFYATEIWDISKTTRIFLNENFVCNELEFANYSQKPIRIVNTLQVSNSSHHFGGPCVSLTAL